MPIISFIIPVFQAEEFLPCCLESIQNQSISDIEILCINDSSTDSSQEILDHYALQDDRIRIFNLPTRRGPGNARNIGIANAAGDYIRMIDADDFIPPDSSKLLLDAAQEYSSDFIKGGYEHCSHKGDILRKGGCFPTTLLANISAETHLQLWHFDQHTTFLFKRDMLKASEIRYNTEMYNGEDVIFMAKLAPLMERVTLIPESVYYYRNNNTSMTRRKRDLQYFTNIFATYHAVYSLRTEAKNEKGLESADYYLFHRFTGMFSTSILPSLYNDLNEEDVRKALDSFTAFLKQFAIFPRIYTHPYPWKGKLIINKELIYLMTVLLHADQNTAADFFYYIAENKLGKKIRTSREKALRRKLLQTRYALQTIQTSTSWRLTSPLRKIVEVWREKKQQLTAQQSAAKSHSVERTSQCEKIYEKIYLANNWLSDESASGRGSTLEHTRVIRQALPKIFKQFNIKTVVDIPCGDFYWMSAVDLHDVEYLGHDIVAEIVRTNQELYAGNNIFFEQLNILEDPLKTANLVFNRDCLVHFSYTDIFQALTNIRNSQSQYLLSTTFPDRQGNTDVETGRQWRPLNLEAPPFNFPPPLLIINEASTESSGRYQDKSLGLWKISDL